MKGVVSVLVSISFLMAICPAVTADLLPGWTMYFIDFDPGQDLDLKVTQRSPDLEEPHPEEPGEFSDFRSATGVGCFAGGGMSGTLFVTQAKWSNTSYNTSPYGVPYIKSKFPYSGFPESAIATGSARLGFFKWKPFMVELLSYEWPDYPNMRYTASVTQLHR